MSAYRLRIKCWTVTCNLIDQNICLESRYVWLWDALNTLPNQPCLSPSAWWDAFELRPEEQNWPLRGFCPLWPQKTSSYMWNGTEWSAHLHQAERVVPSHQYWTGSSCTRSPLSRQVWLKSIWWFLSGRWQYNHRTFKNYNQRKTALW